MKNKKTGIMALILSLTLLCGCGRTDMVLEREEGGIAEKILNYIYPTSYVHNPEGVCFEDIEYVRPDLDKLLAEGSEVMELLGRSLNYFRVTSMLDTVYEDYYNFMTMYTVANIRSLHDLTDEYYAVEYQWCAEASGQVGELFDDICYACADSRLSDLLETYYFWDGFEDDYDNEDDSVYNEKSIALMREENALISEYRSIMAEPTVEWDGCEQSYAQLFDSVEEERLSELIYSYYEKYSELLGELYIRMVDVRRRLAEAMGYDSYEQLQYERTYDRDYTPEDAERYIESIKHFMVPLYKELDENGEYDTETADYSSGLLKKDLQQIISAIGGTADEAMDVMLEYGLCDLEDGAHKAEMSFETYLEDYCVPFLFVDPAGNISDLMVAIHEMGHYTDDYLNFNAYRSLDVSECFSMGLEYLSLDYLDSALDAETAQALRRESLLDAVTAYVMQASYAEFESLVYSTDISELTVDKLREYSLRCAEDFGCSTEGLEDYYSMSWIEITHFFEAPLYVITYPVSNEIALQFYALEQETPGAGVELYYSVMGAEYSTIEELAEGSELKSPFELGRLGRTEAMLRAELGY